MMRGERGVAGDESPAESPVGFSILDGGRRGLDGLADRPTGQGIKLELLPNC